MGFLDAHLSAWPQWDCRKVVRAAKVVSIAEMTGSGTCRVLFVAPFADENRVEPFICSDPAMTDKVVVGWYAVVFADGFKAASPADVFEADYVKRPTA